MSFLFAHDVPPAACALLMGFYNCADCLASARYPATARLLALIRQKHVDSQEVLEAPRMSGAWLIVGRRPAGTALLDSWLKMACKGLLRKKARGR